MIFLYDTSFVVSLQRLEGAQYTGTYTFTLLRAMTNEVRSIVVTDTGDAHTMRFEIPEAFTATIGSGEYTFSIQDSDCRVVASGVARKVETGFPADTVYTGTHSEPQPAQHYDVSISSPVGGHLVVDGETYQTYYESLPEGTILTLQAVPDAGRTFDGWSDGITDNPRFVTVGGDIALSASYELEEYLVEISAGSNGSVSVNGVSGDYSQTVEYGTELTVEALPDTGYSFDQWTDGNTDNPRTITVTGPVTLASAYALETYAVSITAGNNGTVSVNGVSGNYSETVEYGTELTVRAVPNTGYSFTSWSDGGTNATRTVTVTGPVSLTSAYDIATYWVSLSRNRLDGSDTLTVNGVAGYTEYMQYHTYGTQITAEMVVETGYEFEYWKKTFEPETKTYDNPFTFTVTNNTYLTGSSQKQRHLVTITAGQNGLISVNGQTPVASWSETHSYGWQLTVEAVPDANYEFTQWSDGDVTNPRTITVGTSDITLSSAYQIETFAVSITAGSNGTVSVDGVSGDYSQTVAYGTQLTVEAVPDQGYEFVEWSDGDATNPRTVTVTGGLTLASTYQAEVAVNPLNALFYTTTDGRRASGWVTARDENDNVLQPIETDRYGRILYDEPPVKLYIWTNNAGTLESFTTSYKTTTINSGNGYLPNVKRIVSKSPYVSRIRLLPYTGLEYLECWHANNGAVYDFIDYLPSDGTVVCRTDTNLWNHASLADKNWTFEALGTSFTYEAEQQLDMTDHGVVNGNGYVLSPTSHTFSDGIGTLTYDETVGELRDDWSGVDKVCLPDTVGFFEYVNNGEGWKCDLEVGEYFGIVGGGLNNHQDWDYMNMFNGGIDTTKTVTVRNANPILFVGTDNAIYHIDGTGLYVTSLAFQNDRVAEFAMDDRCVDATIMFREIDCGGITRLVLGDGCESLKLHPRRWSSEFSFEVGELVANDELRSVNANRNSILTASGGSNNPYLNISQHLIESADHSTLYWTSDAASDLSGYSTFEESCCAGLRFAAMPDISSATTVKGGAFYEADGVSTWVWPDNNITFYGYMCLYGSDITRVEFGTRTVQFENSSQFYIDNVDTLVFGSMTPPTQADQYNAVFQSVRGGGKIYIPLGADYSTFLNYPGNANNIGQWTVKYIMDDTQLAVKHTPGVTINAPTISGLTFVSSEDSNGWLKATYDNDIVTYASTDLQNNADVLEVVLPESCTGIGNGAFLGCSSLSNVAVGDNCTTIGDSAFFGTALTRFDAKGVTSFGSIAFGGCASLESVEFGGGLTSVGQGLFHNCTSLEYVGFVKYSGPTVTNDLGQNINTPGTILVPAYADYSTYSDFINAMPAGWTVVRQLDSQVMYHTSDGNPIGHTADWLNNWGVSLVSHTYGGGYGIVEYSGAINRIDGYAFDNNSNMDGVWLPDTLQVIDGWSFSNCPIVTIHCFEAVQIPGGVEHIGAGAFDSFTGTTVEFGSALESLDGSTFKSDNLTDVYVNTTNTMRNEYGGSPFVNAPATGTLHMVAGADSQFWTGYLPGWTVVTIS